MTNWLCILSFCPCSPRHAAHQLSKYNAATGGFVSIHIIIPSCHLVVHQNTLKQLDASRPGRPPGSPSCPPPPSSAAGCAPPPPAAPPSSQSLRRARHAHRTHRQTQEDQCTRTITHAQSHTHTSTYKHTIKTGRLQLLSRFFVVPLHCIRTYYVLIQK